MDRAMDHLDRVSTDLQRHELYTWITSARHEDTRRHYDGFVPILNMIVTFPYYNDQYLAYRSLEGTAAPDAEGAAPDDLDPLRKIINLHVCEDRTHARLFLHDVRVLDLARVWGIDRASTLLWALWVSPLLDPAQEVASHRIRMLVDPRDEWPPFRYLHIEQLERDGNLLFSAATRKSAEVSAQHSVTPLYFAEHHLDRETGHVGSDEFVKVAMSDDQAEHARQIIDRKQADSIAMNDVMLRFARAAERFDTPGQLLAEEHDRRVAHVQDRIEAHLARRLPVPTWDLPSPFYAEQSELIAAYHRHHADFVSHPFSALFRDAHGRDAAFALRCSSLILARRICALHPFYKYDCRVAEGISGPAAEVANFLSDTIAMEAQIFFYDWKVLDMDRRIPWDLAELLEWWFLDPIYGRPELETLHEFRREALRVHDDPIVKYWVFMCISMMSRAFFGAAQALIERFAKDHPELPPLMYLTGMTSHLLYDEGSPNWLSPPHPTSLAHLPITAGQREYILRMMGVFARHGRTAFDQIVRALTVDRARFAFLEEEATGKTPRARPRIIAPHRRGPDARDH